MRSPILNSTGEVVNVIEIKEADKPTFPLEDGLSFGASGGEIGQTWTGTEYYPPPRPSQWHNWDKQTKTWVEDTAEKDAAATEAARIEDTKNDAEGMAFLDLMKSKTSVQRASWLSANVADPNVRKVLQGLMSLVLWKVA